MSSAKPQTQLKLASNKLEYHVAMYVQTYEWLRLLNSAGPLAALITMMYRFVSWTYRRRFPGFLHLVPNSIEESNAIHARLLIEFLAHSRKTDINAADFFPVAHPTHPYPLPNSFLKAEKQQVEQRLIHLTIHAQTQRIDQIKWPCDQIAVELEKELRKFLITVPQESISHLRLKDQASCLKYLDRLVSALP